MTAMNVPLQVAVTFPPAVSVASMTARSSPLSATLARSSMSPAIGVVGQVLRGGVDKGLFRADVAARDVYLLIAATGYFYQSNRYTLSAFLGEDLSQPEAVAHWEAFVKQSVLRTVLLDARSMTAS